MVETKNKRDKSNKPILSDHKKVGKTLLPPMVHMLPGVMSPTHFDRDTLPELIWLALIENACGLEVAANLAATLGKYIEDCKSECRFITLSEMHKVSKEEWGMLRAYLDTSGVLVDLVSTIHDFIILYPECPLVNIFAQRPIKLKNSDFLSVLETLLGELMHKRGRKAVLMQANAIYLLGCQGKLFIKEGLSLGNLEELRNYPETEESKIVGASVCSASSMLLMMKPEDDEQKWSWPNYFWERNLQLKPIDLSHLKEHE